jgi:hypothetical protein
MIGPLLDDGAGIYGGVITIGNNGGDTYGYSDGSFGSLSPTTFVSRDGNTRTIINCVYNTTSGQFQLILSGSVSNTDAAAFIGLIIAGVFYARSSFTYGTPSGNSSWSMTPGSNVIGTSGTRGLVLE